MFDIIQDKQLLRASLKIARRSLEKGNLPFGCLLADANGQIIEEAENTVISDADSIAHCEINLAHQLSGKYEFEYLQTCSLYASTEPCPMCTGAMFWCGIGTIVFALSKERYHALTGTINPAYIFNISQKSYFLMRDGK
jgi:tRNA(Arg) A34 adenosine deaminase TadA